MLSNRKITLAQNQLHQQLSWANLKIIHHCSSSFTIIFNVIRTITFITTIISTAYSSIKISTPCQFCLICTTQHQSLLRLQILHNGGKCCRWKLPPPDSSKQQLQAHQAWETSTWLRIFKPKFEKQLHARQSVLQGLSTPQGEHNHKRLRPSEKKASDSCILRSCQSTPWSQQTKPTHSKAIQSIVRSRPRMWISLQPRRMWRSS